MGNFLGSFWKKQDGSSTVEFVLIFPAIITLVFGVIESGWLMTRYMMLDRGLDITMRELRLGLMANPSADTIRDKICENARILPNCKTELVIELVKRENFDPTANCFPRQEVDPKPVINVDPNTFDPGQEVFVRACSLVDPMLPGLEFGLLLPKDSQTGAHHMISYSAYMNEPA